MFRRFRAEVLRKVGVPEDLVRYWMGHAGHADEIGEFTRNSTVTDLYAAGAKMMSRGVVSGATKWG
jgi:hypothetical protein